ncbi:substrate-binding domain-containing protein [Chelativorans sp. AA-79]|uniref:substrate-binding domain-containing protein n=1 Tax=Chelativorans sp. AA-79 TaxID=3028735 RepID=UPI0023F708A7|nr:substrate-binding domain-containing protein [Chelativorans sp. AA-79]WEX08993.1 substrate-binding domain-containing protein [Chelativorans sp. AA-79]
MKHMTKAALAATIALCAVGTAEAQDDIRIGAIYMDAQGFYAGVRQGIQDAAAEAGRDLEIIETNAQGDVAQESSFMDALIAANVDAIITSPVSADGSYRSIQRAHDAGIPVICYNTCLSEADMEEFVSAYTVGDPFDFGNMLGLAAADYFEAEGITAPKIAVLNCEFVEVCITRREGFEAALADRGIDYEIVANQEGAILDNAISVASNILTANPEFDAIFGEAGGATLGAARAIRSQGRVGEVVVFGGDMTTEIAQELEEHDVIKAVVDISGQGMGRLAFEQAVNVIEGNPPEGIKVPYEIDLYASSEDGAGWQEAHPNGIP